MSAIASEKPWKHDASLIDRPWREVDKAIATSKTQESGTLCFARMDSDGVVSPHPPIARGMRIVVEALEKAGHRVSVTQHL